MENVSVIEFLVRETFGTDGWTQILVEESEDVRPSRFTAGQLFVYMKRGTIRVRAALDVAELTAIEAPEAFADFVINAIDAAVDEASDRLDVDESCEEGLESMAALEAEMDAERDEDCRGAEEDALDRFEENHARDADLDD